MFSQSDYRTNVNPRANLGGQAKMRASKLDNPFFMIFQTRPFRRGKRVFEGTIVGDGVHRVRVVLET